MEYASRLLSASERNYSTTEREALAVVWAVKRFRGYIEGTEVVLRSDHQPLKWLLSIKTPTGRLARWALELQSYNLKIEYTPGKNNVVADTLSRPPLSENQEIAICNVTVELPRYSPKELRTEQMEDPELVKIIQEFESLSDDSNRWAERGYLMEKGVLYRYSAENDTEEAQLVVPAHKRKQVLAEYHDSETACHDGVDRTLGRIRLRYYWPGMRKTVLEYVKSCVDCQRFKPSNLKPAGLLQTPVQSARFEVLSVDYFGPLPPSSKGNRWILIVEDAASRWVELFALPDATAIATATTLIEEVFFRYGVPRALTSDNGVQFVSAVVQRVCTVLNIKD